MQTTNEYINMKHISFQVLAYRESYFAPDGISWVQEQRSVVRTCSAGEGRCWFQQHESDLGF